MKLPYLITANSTKRADMLSYATGDKFFSSIVHDLNDFGHEISFSGFGGAGAYEPFALSTEKIGTPEKQQQFTNGFWNMFEAGRMKAKLRFSAILGADINAHYFLHELMHFYQDMHGLYMLPLQEEGAFPTLLDAESDIVAIMFCEAWAEVEAIRASWSLREHGDKRGWNGAIKSPDWQDLSMIYDKGLQSGIDEKCAAANIFKMWYEGAHRQFYEAHGLKIHEINFARFKEGAQEVSNQDIGASFRKLELPMLIARLPKGGIPDYFANIDWCDDIYSSVKSPDISSSISKIEELYGAADNPNIQDIKCGSPPYIWNRLRMAEQKDSDITHKSCII